MERSSGAFQPTDGAKEQERGEELLLFDPWRVEENWSLYLPQ